MSLAVVSLILMAIIALVAVPNILGARDLGRAAIIFTVVAMMFGVAASQGYVPGLEPTDRGLPPTEPGAPAGAVD